MLHKYSIENIASGPMKYIVSDRVLIFENYTNSFDNTFMNKNLVIDYG